MRIDKYLKLTRIIKRRTVAKDITNAERIMVNDRVVKPSYQVGLGDIITIGFGNKEVKIKVTEINEYATKSNSTDMYELISEEKISN